MNNKHLTWYDRDRIIKVVAQYSIVFTAWSPERGWNMKGCQGELVWEAAVILLRGILTCHLYYNVVPSLLHCVPSMSHSYHSHHRHSTTLLGRQASVSITRQRKLITGHGKDMYKYTRTTPLEHYWFYQWANFPDIKTKIMQDFHIS